MNSSEWIKCKLGDVINFRRGHDLSKNNMNAGKYPVVGSNGVIGYHNKYTTESPCITIGRSGNIGTPYIYNQRCWAHNTTLYIDDYKGNNPEFIYYLLKNINLAHYAGGSAVPTLNRNHIHPIEINFPNTLKEQEIIASILLALDKKIELNKQINETLESMAQEIFKHWFVDFEFPNKNGKPYKSSGGKMVESEMGIIPKGWKERPLYDFAKYINGTSFKKDEYSASGYPIIKISELKNGITASTQYFQGIRDEKYFIKDGDILFSWSGNPETSIDTFIWAGGTAILNQHTFKIEVLNDDYAFIYLVLKYFKPQFTRIASGKQTTGLGHVTVKDLKRLRFQYNEKIVLEFCSVVNPILQQYSNNLFENKELSNIRDILLPKLISGEIRVPIDN